MKHQPNNPALAGRLASSVIVFGRAGRYQLAAVHTRFDAVQFFVWDLEELDEAGLPRVVRQESTDEAARRGLEGDRLLFVRAEETSLLEHALLLAADGHYGSESARHFVDLSSRLAAVGWKPEAPLDTFWVVLAPASVLVRCELADVLWKGDLATLRLVILGGGVPLALYPEWAEDSARAHALAVLGPVCPG